MSTYEEEHGIQQNSRDYQEVGETSQEEQRRQVRSQLQGLFQNFGNTSGEGDAHSDSTLLLRLLSQLLPESLQEEWLQEMDKGKSAGCPDTFAASLPRINKKKLKATDNCSICYTNYLEDEYPLVVELPHCHHKFDLECLSVWLSRSTTCPLCRDNVMGHRIINEIDTTEAELEEDWGMYG
ncbi:XXYS1_4_G0016950.mRNA.1.CDS.1 [Saccharomyces cerevisiae]|nr:XXYS1_4_G0016950.mRNA.1.CDS.1 [Saccharomyces cerevisiae]CAD6598796.1 EM14S01-3B_G0014390.mRNA.1.CDS.1 [Saccharomyces cerevisiae]CAI4262556.1 AMH_1a_G0002630.mRNA.1.CDS.1 [Saccharomyces cerevisiae]CAI4267551.1 CEI_1a_G0002480.mRNA.1.CDS.1 [Saccharomyces cerevisiae]CAI6490131.1 AMH_1a_G0002630.mRNA.1.CDS.1 [Saccharomyces cerevisiae]